jgi:predicted nuclease with TOPRIM domain
VKRCRCKGECLCYTPRGRIEELLEERNALRAQLEESQRVRAELARANSVAHQKLDALSERMARVEGERDRLRAALEEVAKSPQAWNVGGVAVDALNEKGGG